MFQFAALTAVLLCLAAAANALSSSTDDPVDLPIEELHAWETYIVERDGRYMRDDDVTFLVRNQEGVHRNSQVGLRYDASREILDIVEAYTETPDGRKIAVKADRILTEESPLAIGAPKFANVRIKQIIFPDVEVHAKLHYKARLAVKQPLFPGYFNIEDFVDPHTVDEDDRITVYAAQGMSFAADVAGFRGGAIACPPQWASRRCYNWTANNLLYVPPEPGSVSPTDYSQHIILSNFPNYGAIAIAYWKRAAEKVRVSPRIEALADTLTKGLIDKRAEAEMLYEWVAENIRYVAVYIGAGSVVPHDAEEILETRYGDCKDHVTLLQALLAAKHIESVGVLVAANRRWVMPRVPDPHVFNHIITYIPSLDVYLDSTSQFSRYGQLPPIVIGKVGLKTQPISNGSQLDLVRSSISKDYVKTNVEIAVQPDGSASGTASVQAKGTMEIALRSSFAALPAGEEESLTHSILARFNESGSGSFMRGDPRDLSKPFSYQTRFTISHLVNMPGPGAFPLPTGLHIPPHLADLAHGAPLLGRKFPWTCGMPGISTETTRLALPPTVGSVRLPEDVQTQNDFGRYEAHYEYQSHIVTATRLFERTVTHHPCDDHDYQQFRKLTVAIDRDMKSEILFQ